MATFSGRNVSATYKGLLNIDNNNAGVDGTTRTVQDGEGTSSALQLSSSVVNVNGTFKVGGFTVTVPAAVTFGGTFTTVNNFTMAGNFAFTATLSNTTTVTFPTTGTLSTLAGTETFTNKTLTTPVIAQINDSSGNEYIILSSTASAVNEITINNAATGTGPTVKTTGGDTNAPITISGKGTGAVILGQATSTDVRLIADQPITDSSGNEYLKFAKTASAVNEITIQNGATGNGATIAATGGDTNINFDMAAKGTGVYRMVGSATAPAALRIFEQTTNGTNYRALMCPAAATGDITWTLPATDGTGLLESNGSAVLSFGTLTGTPATQTAQETGTSIVAAVTPGRQQYHPSAAKFWVNGQTSAGTPSVLVSYNITSVTDNGVGIYTMNITTAFSSANFAAGQACDDDGAAVSAYYTSKTASTYQISTLVTTSGANADTSNWSCWGYGDQ